MKTFYIAASYESKELMREHRDELVAMGHRVTSRWIDQLEDGVKDFQYNDSLHKGNRDMEDINRCWTVLVFTEVPTTTGGLHVELGYALGEHKTVVIIGPITNIFQRQATWHYDNWEEFKKGFPL